VLGTRKSLVVGRRSCATRRALAAVTKFADIDLEFTNGAAQRIAVHSQLAGGTALVALVFPEDRSDETLLKLSDRLGVQNIAFVHLLHERF